jgi:glucose/arabinose dehydrogenase
MPLPSATPVPSLSGFPDPAGVEWRMVTGGLVSPIGLANAGDGSHCLFVLEQSGVIQIVQNGNLLPVPFLDIRDRVGSSGNEQGLLGLAFHPDYETNGYFFVNYTDQNGDTVIARYQVSVDNPDRADRSSERHLLNIPQPFPNHNGGMVAFGTDGYLYLGLGDGGSGGDPLDSGQSVNTLLGKILRIDVNGGDPYLVPADNPFTGGLAPEIWAYGLRNPWRFSFDRLTGDLYIGDVGQGSWEEISYLPAGSPGGANFGWNVYEGWHPYGGSASSAGGELTFPIFEYGHDQGCSVTGGYVYRGTALPQWNGVYLFGDYCTGYIWGLLPDGQGGWLSDLLFDGMGQITSFGEDEAGELYLTDRAGIIYRLSSK